IQCLAFAPDGKSLVAGGSKGLLGGSAGWLKQWDTARGKPLRSYEQLSAITTLSFNPDGRSVAFSETGQMMKFGEAARSVVKVLDLATQKVIWESKDDLASPPTVVHDPSAKVLAFTCLDGSVHVW